MSLLLALILLAGPAAALQPEGRDVVSHDRRVDVQHLHLDVAVDIAAGTVGGTTTHTVTPLRAGLTEVVLHGIGLDVSQVLIDGTPTTFTIEPTTIRIALPNPTVLGQQHTIATTYTASPTTGMHFRRAAPHGQDAYDEAWTQGEDIDHRHWFPGWDAPDDRFTLTVTASAPNKYSAVSNGTLRSRTPDPQRPGWTKWAWGLEGGDVVNYLVVLAVAAYERGQTTWRGRPVMWFTPPGTAPEVAEATVGRTVAMLDHFSEITGVEYPYNAYNQIFVQRFIYTGMENTSSTIIDERILADADHVPLRPYIDGIIAHELAHQWYGDQLTLRTWREMWLNEGFATFIGAEWTAEADGPYAASETILKRYAGERRADDRTARPLVLDFFNKPADGRASNPYGKGASVLQMLRAYLGHDAFWRGIQAYTRDFQHKNVETDDLRRSLEEASGLALEWFFDQYVRSPGHPKLAISASADAEAGVVRIGLKQTQNADWPTFTVPLDVEVATTTGTHVHRVWMDDRASSAIIPIEGDLLYVAPDPTGGQLGEITFSQGHAAWRTLLRQSPHPYAKMLALQLLQEVPPSDDLRALVHGLVTQRTTDPAMRRAAIKTVSKWAGTADFDTLLAALEGEPDGRIREHLLKGLGEALPRNDIIAAVSRVLRDDPLVDPRAVAVETLAKLEGDDVRRRLFPLLRDRSGPNQLVERQAARALGKHGRPADLGALADLRGASTNIRTRSVAWDASIALLKKAPLADRDPLRKELAREAERMLEDDFLRARQKASHLLRTVGDERSIRALQARRGKELQESVRASFDKSIEAIRARKDTEPDPTDGELKAKLKALEERVEAAEKELKALQEKY